MLALTAALLGCAPTTSPQGRSFRIPLRYSTASGRIALRPLATLPAPVLRGHEAPAPHPGALAYFAPNDQFFALSLDTAEGSAEIGSVRPFALHRVELGRRVRVVGLTDRFLIGSAWRGQRGYL